MALPTTPEDYKLQLQQLERKRKFADALRAQSMDMPQGQMVSGWYVAPSITQNLAKLLQASNARGYEEEANTKQKALADELMGRKKEWLGAMPKPSESLEYATDGMGPPATKINQPGEQDYLNWAMQGMEIDPAMAQAGFGMADRLSARADRNQQLQAQREQRQSELQFRADQEARARQERFDQQQQMVRLAASLRPQPQERMVSVIGPDGQTPVLVPQSQARGMTPFTAGGSAAGSPVARVRDAQDAMTILQQAAPLINKSTGSGLGNVVDTAQAFFGGSNPGAEAAAQLKVLGGALVSKMPKMSGPQSDKDVLLYKEMAGRIGDPTVPAAQKKQAMSTINELQAKYAGAEVTPLDFGDATGNKPLTGMPSQDAIAAELARRRGGR